MSVIIWRTRVSGRLRGLVCTTNEECRSRNRQLLMMGCVKHVRSPRGSRWVFMSARLTPTAGGDRCSCSVAYLFIQLPTFQLKTVSPSNPVH